MTEAVVETRALAKRFGAKLAVADLSLRVARGEVFGFLGPNGAGKTTSLKMLLGLVTPSGGTAMVLGRPLGDRAARGKLGFLPEHFRFQDWLTGRELLRFHGRLYGLGGASLERRIDELLERVDLTDAAERRVKEYSKGMLQRVGIAQALLNHPALVFLDEPTSGLDPLGRLLVRDLIRDLKAEGTSVFLNSHLLGEVEATCDRVVFVKQGRTVHEHRLAADDRLTMVHVKIGADATTRTMAGLSAFGQVHLHDADGVRVAIADPERVPDIVQWLVRQGVRIYGVSTAHQSLEELFLEVMGEDQRPG